MAGGDGRFERMGEPQDSHEVLLREEGFANQRHVAFIMETILLMRRHPILKGLHVTTCGVFPSATGHHVERPEGALDAIVIICLKGRGWVRVAGGDSVSVSASEAVFVAPGTPHAYGSDPDDSWSIAWAHFNGTDATAYLQMFNVGADNPKVTLRPVSSERLGFEEVIGPVEYDYLVTSLLTSATALRQIFSRMLRYRRTQNAVMDTAEDGVRATVAWLTTNYPKKVTLGDLARMAGISAPHYSSLFHRVTGHSPISHLLRVRIHNACRILDTTTDSVEMVAAQTGFQDPYYFSRVFKKLVGVSPVSYRNRTDRSVLPVSP